MLLQISTIISSNALLFDTMLASDITCAEIRCVHGSSNIGSGDYCHECNQPSKAGAGYGVALCSDKACLLTVHIPT